MGATRAWFVFFLQFLIVAFLSGCGAALGNVPHSRSPELVRLRENTAATYRIDIVSGGHGSGVVVSAEGHILTAFHVVEDDEDELVISIIEGGGKAKTYKATVVCVDKLNDLAVVKIDRRFRDPVLVASEADVHPGDSVYNVGYPYDFGSIVGRGYVMKQHYTLTGKGKSEIVDATLVDLPDGPGTSGSGIFASADGKLIGIMRMMFWVTNGKTPPMVVRVIASPKHIRALLDANKIPYLSDLPAK